MKKILLIEDDFSLANTIRDFLFEQTHFVKVATNGSIGYVEAVNNSYDLIILETILPYKSGFVISRDLRSNGIETPIIALTADYNESTRITCWQMGIDLLIGKPFSLKELNSTIEKIFKRPPTNKHEYIKIRDIEVDKNLQIVRREGVVIPLRKKESDIVMYLTENKGKLVSKQTLYNSIYPWDSNTMASVLDVHISNIRKKLNEGFKRDADLIKTVHSKGFLVEG